MAGKQLGKLRQWAGEVMLSRERTQPTSEFLELERDVDLRKAGVDKLKIVAEEYHASIFRKKFSEALTEPEKLMPVEALGLVMIAHGEEFGEDSAFGTSLVAFGRAHCRIAVLQESYAVTFSDTYLNSLQASSQELNEFTLLRKKLESRRLTYDAAISKADKTFKKEKDRKEAEEELSKAKQRYEETAEDLKRRIDQIREGEINQFRDLTAFLELELNYATQYLKVIKEIKNNWIDESSIRKDMKFTTDTALHSFESPSIESVDDHMRTSTTSPTTSNVINLDQRSDSSMEDLQSTFQTHRRKSDSGTHPPSISSRSRANSTATTADDTTREKDDRKRGTRIGNVSGWVGGAVSSVTGRGKNKHLEKDNFTSLIDEHDTSAAGNTIPSRPKSSMSNRSTKSIRSNKWVDSPDSTAPPMKGKDRKLVKAVHDFTGAQDELSFKAGERITVVQEVLDGWWMGELDGRTGLFPTTYVESVPQHEIRSNKPSLTSLFKMSTASNVLGVANLPFNRSEVAVEKEEKEIREGLMNRGNNEEELFDVVGSDSDDDEHPFSNRREVIKPMNYKDYGLRPHASSVVDDNESDNASLEHTNILRVATGENPNDDKEYTTFPQVESSTTTSSEDTFADKYKRVSPPPLPPPPPLPKRRIADAPPLPPRSKGVGQPAGDSVTTLLGKGLIGVEQDGSTSSSPFMSAAELNSNLVGRNTTASKLPDCRACGCQVFKQSPFQDENICTTCFHSHS